MASKSPRARLLHSRDEIEGVGLTVRGLCREILRRKPARTVPRNGLGHNDDRTVQTHLDLQI